MTVFLTEWTLKLADFGTAGPGTPDSRNAEGRRRLVCLGDSFIVGTVYGVRREDSVCNLLQQKMPEWQVINLGQTGTGPVDYWRVWDQIGRHYDPDVVLTFCYVGNDMFDVYAEARKVGYELDDIKRLLAEERIKYQP